MEGYCFSMKALRSFANKVLDKLTDEQLQILGISKDELRDNTVDAIMQIAKINLREATAALAAKRLEQIDEFIDDLINRMLTKKVAHEIYDSVTANYKDFLNYFEGRRIGSLYYADDEKAQQDAYNDAEVLRLNGTWLTSYIQYAYNKETGEKIYVTIKDKEGNPKKVPVIKHLSYILKEPQKVEKTAQQVTLERLDNLGEKNDSSNIQRTGRVEIANPSGRKQLVSEDELNEDAKKPEDKRKYRFWKKTGRLERIIEGKKAVVESVSVHVHGYVEDLDIPALSSPLGTVVDVIGRNFFNKTLFWDKEGKLLSDKELEGIINLKLGRAFTVKGLTNLLGDFEELEKQLREKFNDQNLKYYPSSINLLGKISGNEYMLGQPDLIVIDSRGKLHLVDFKTVHVGNVNNYNTLMKEYNRGVDYGKQVSRYIQMLEAQGFEVDRQPYIVQIDTWYSSFDHGYSHNRNSEGELKGNRKDIYEIRAKKFQPPTYMGIVEEENGIVTRTSLGQYVEETGTAGISAEEAIAQSEMGILYIEPRLHVKKVRETFSSEIAALRDNENEIPYDPSMTFEQQVEKLNAEEKKDMKWFMGPVWHDTESYGIDLSSLDTIDSKPDLISPEELRLLADNMAYWIEEVLQDVSKGEEFTLFFLRREGVKGLKEYKGKSPAEILRAYRVDTFLEVAFRYCITGKYNKIYHKEYEELSEREREAFGIKSKEQYEQKQKMALKAHWIMNHKEEFYQRAGRKLKALENTIITQKIQTKKAKEQENQGNDAEGGEIRESISPDELKEDAGDNASLDSFIDNMLEGFTDLQAWMMGVRNISPKSSLAKEIRKIFENLILKEKKEENGKIVLASILDPYGWGMELRVDPTMALQAVQDALKDCETYEEMVEALQDMADNDKNLWVLQILEELRNGDENLRTKFFRYMQKDALIYSNVHPKYDKATGKMIWEVAVINRKSAYQTMLDELGSDYRNGRVGRFTVNGRTYDVIKYNEEKGHERNELVSIINKPVLTYVRQTLDIIKAAIDDCYRYAETEWVSENMTSSREGYIQKYLKNARIKEVKNSSLKHFEGKSLSEAVAECLQAVGIMVPSNVIDSVIDKGIDPIETECALYKIVDYIRNIARDLSSMNTGMSYKRKTIFIPSSLAGNPAFKYYQPLVRLLSDGVQEYVEASTYADGKSYYTYVPPSRLEHIVRNLSNAKHNDQKFEKYLQRNYKRYRGWFTSVDGKEWLCDWLRQLERDSSARNALKHKVEISFNKMQYKNMGPLVYQKSILAHYFNSEEDSYENGDYRWFAVPTMSNKPVNEFIRMLKYIDKKHIVESVMMPTFQQECNRIADVLFYLKEGNNGIDQMDLNDDKLQEVGLLRKELIDKIDSANTPDGGITGKDLQALLKTDSGAKFHFLWYLNNRIVNNEELADRIATKINILLVKQNKNTPKVKYNGAEEVKTAQIVQDIINEELDKIVKSELKKMRDIGLFDTETNNRGETVLKHQAEFHGKLGSYKRVIAGNVLTDSEALAAATEEMEEALTDFILQDIAANINIIQLTGGDLAYYGNAVNYQKRIAMIHSSGLKLRDIEEVSDGFLRSVHITDLKMGGKNPLQSTLGLNARVAMENYLETAMKNASPEDKKAYKEMIEEVVKMFDNINITDGQSYSCLTSRRKKAMMEGEWDNELEDIYQKIINDNLDINTLHTIKRLQPQKPLVATTVAKYSGSPTMGIRKVPLQDKNSEYLLFLADAFAKKEGKRNRMKAINDFMEATHKLGDGRHGIDTVHFESVGKVGVSGVIDIGAFDADFDERLGRGEVKEEDYERELTQYLLDKVKRKKNSSAKDEMDAGLLKEETYYDNYYVDTYPVEDYIIQQEVPAHFLDHEQLIGSQQKILSISDITPGTTGFDVDGKKMNAEELIKEYKGLHAANIYDARNALLRELGLDKLISKEEVEGRNGEKLTNTVIKTLYTVTDQNVKNEIYQKFSDLLIKEILKDSRYDEDLARALTLVKDDNGNVIGFTTPLFDPCQSNRIQMLLCSIIKKSINKQTIAGGPVVQVTAYDHDLNVVFKDKDGNRLKTLKEYGKSVEEYKKYLKENQAGIMHFEAYAPVPDPVLEALLRKPDGTLMSPQEAVEAGVISQEKMDEMTKMIGYRIPSEDKYSMIPIKIVGWTSKFSGEVLVLPQEITKLTGSDFDIDKIYLMRKAWEWNLPKMNWDKGDINRQQIQQIWGARIEQNAQRILAGEAIRLDHNIDFEHYVGKGGKLMDAPKVMQEDAKRFLEYYRKAMLEGVHVFSDLSAERKSALRNARNNRILDLQWAVLTHHDTLSKMLNPQSFDPIKLESRIIKILKSETEDEQGERWTREKLAAIAKKGGLKALDALIENIDPHNTTLPSSKIYFQKQNMQGSQMVGTFANHNVSHAFCSFQKIAISLKSSFIDRSFIFNGVSIGGDTPTLIDQQRGFNGQLISKLIASFLAASVDTAKEPCLDDLNVNTFTGGVAMTLARLGFGLEEIGLFLSQPAIVKLSEIYFKNNIDEDYSSTSAILELAKEMDMKRKDLDDTSSIRKIGESALSVESFLEHLNDKSFMGDTVDKDQLKHQQNVLKAFWALFNISKDMSKLTHCTKFNSVINSPGPTIEDTEEMTDRVEDFIMNIEDSCFYVPPEGDKRYSNPAHIIENDPILEAYYNCTVGTLGASKTIFENFFPHYYPGFLRLKKHFKENYVKGGRLDSATSAQLLNDYMYFLLTYEDGENVKSTLPHEGDEVNLLTDNIVRLYEELAERKDRKPNILLDRNLGGNCLRVKKANEYFDMDTLEFSSGKLDAAARAKVKSAWEDLVTSEDPKEREFGVQLFFYSLMRNGFNFSPKTLMHIASTIVRISAKYGGKHSSYLEGLNRLYTIDTAFNSVLSDFMFDRFCNQFVRNHANNKPLIPNVKGDDARLEVSLGGRKANNEITFRVKAKDDYKLNSIRLNSKKPCPFITVTFVENGKLYRDQYQLVAQDIKEDETEITYRRVQKLGVANQFVEYDANRSIDNSLYMGVRIESEDDVEDENPEPSSKAEQTNGPEEFEAVETDPDWEKILKEFIAGTPWDNTVLRGIIKSAYNTYSTGGNSELADAFQTLLSSKSSTEKREEAEKEIRTYAFKRATDEVKETVRKRLNNKMHENGVSKETLDKINNIISELNAC